jgi:hypothetical protein
MRSLFRASLCASVLFAVLSLSTNLPEEIAHEFFATCYGSDPCHACKNLRLLRQARRDVWSL